MTISETKKELVEGIAQVREIISQLEGLQQTWARAHDKLSELEHPKASKK